MLNIEIKKKKEAAVTMDLKAVVATEDEHFTSFFLYNELLLYTHLKLNDI